MTDTIALREKIKESGYKLVFIANKIGLTYQGFLKKLNNSGALRSSAHRHGREGSHIFLHRM